MKNFKLADPNFNNSADIDLLIGANLYGRAISGYKLELGKLATAIETIFDYTSIGPIQASKLFKNSIYLLLTNDINLN